MPLLFTWDDMVYGSGHRSAGGSGKAASGRDSEDELEKWIVQLLVARSNYMQNYRKDALRFEVEGVKAQVNYFGAWEDLARSLEETKGKDVRTAIEQATRAHGDMLQAKARLDGLNRRSVGAASGSALGYRESTGSRAEEALAYALTDPNSGLYVGNTALPEMLDRLKSDLYGGAAYDPKTNKTAAFAGLGEFPGGGHSDTLTKLMRLEEDAAQQRIDVQIADQTITDLKASIDGAQADLSAGRSVDLQALSEKARGAVMTASTAVGGKTLTQAEEELKALSKEDETVKALDDAIARLTAKAAAPGSEGDSIREQMGIMVSGPKFKNWAEQMGLAIGTSEVVEVTDKDGNITRTLKPGTYREGKDDTKAAMLWQRQEQSPPENRWQIRDTGLLGRALLSESSPAMQAHFQLPEVEGLADVSGKYARIAETLPDGTTTYTYLDPAQVSAILRANGQPEVTGKGTPEVWAGEDKDGRRIVRVQRRGQEVFYSVGDDERLHLEPSEPAVGTWMPVAKEGRYMSSAGLRDGRQLPAAGEVEAIATEEERAKLVGRPGDLRSTLDRLDIELSDEAPGRNAWVYGAVVPSDPRDAKGTVRMSTGTGLLVLGTDPNAPVQRVEILGEKAKKGPLAIQSQVRGKLAEKRARELGKEAPGEPVKRDLIFGVETYDVRAEGAPGARPPGPIGKLVDVLGAALAPEPPRGPAERLVTRTAARFGRAEAEERAAEAEREVPSPEAVAEGRVPATWEQRRAEKEWERMTIDERFKAIRSGRAARAQKDAAAAEAEAEQRREMWDKMIRDASGMPEGAEKAALWDRIVRESAGQPLTDQQKAAIESERAKRPAPAAAATEPSEVAQWQVRPSFEAAPAGATPPTSYAERRMKESAEAVEAAKPKEAERVGPGPAVGPKISAALEKMRRFFGTGKVRAAPPKEEAPTSYAERRMREAAAAEAAAKGPRPGQFERAGTIVTAEVKPPTAAIGGEVVPTSQESKPQMADLKRRVNEFIERKRLRKEAETAGALGAPELEAPRGAAPGGP